MEEKELESGRELAEAKADYTWWYSISSLYPQRDTPTSLLSNIALETLESAQVTECCQRLQTCREICRNSYNDIIWTDKFLPKPCMPGARFSNKSNLFMLSMKTLQPKFTNRSGNQGVSSFGLPSALIWQTASTLGETL